jgi:hypothetical protein
MTIANERATVRVCTIESLQSITISFFQLVNVDYIHPFYRRVELISGWQIGPKSSPSNMLQVVFHSRRRHHGVGGSIVS